MKDKTMALMSRSAKGLFAAALVASVAAPVAIRAKMLGPGNERGTSDERSSRDDRGDRDRDDNRGSTATPITHVVVIFQENVSFDHYFATYPNAANTDGSMFKAKAGTPLVDGLF
ncbi:MAG TPA: alkaline phosphatase family protein, partial [Vicinamibacterales bacterium]|nr:alkaline phosphatase family protein [Vicinamibacterales bacterium]